MYIFVIYFNNKCFDRYFTNNFMSNEVDGCDDTRSRQFKMLPPYGITF